MTLSTQVSRRRFLSQASALSGGLTLALYLPTTPTVAAQGDGATEVNAWLVVQPDETVIIRYARSEMGQGSSTAAPMLVAEELECDWKNVRMEYASANEHIRRGKRWGSMATNASITIRSSHDLLRRAGASARQMLVAAAAQKLGVEVAECSATLGVVTHVSSGRKLTFGQVAQAAGLMAPPKEVKLKDPKDWKLIGQPKARFDIPDTVMGRQRYGIDVQLPGMVYAAVRHAPVFGARVQSFDAAKLAGMRGFIKVVPIEGGLAVVADNWWRAKEMALTLPVVWDEGAGPLATNASIDGLLRAALDRPTPAVAREKGRTADAFASAGTAGKVLEAEYFTPFLAHATLEPQVCTALLKNGKLEVWASTQNAESSLGHAAITAGVPPENVEIHRMQCGGGFGRRAASQDFIRQGVTIAKAMEGTPVKMLWTREEDTQHDFYRPVAMYRMRASLDAQRKPEAWSTRIAMPSLFATLLRIPLKDGLDPMAIEGFADFPYEFPNQRMEYARCDTPVPVGFWRGVGHSQNPFARECFMDEVAHAAGQDPLEFRRALLAHEPRTLGVLEAVAKAANWGGALPAGVFRGIAVSEPYGSYAAAVIEVSVDAKGVLLIHRVVVAIDCGYMVNPDTVVAQTQGCVVFGLTAALSGDITIKDGRVVQSNFHDYPLMRMAEIPRVEVVLAPSGGFWGGVGEPGLAPIAPALCNAIFEATGKRIRALPINQHDLRKA